MQPGKLTWLLLPLLPDAMTVAMLALRSVLMIAVVAGSLPSQSAEKRPPPRLMFAEAIAIELLSVFTRLSPATMSLL